MAFLWQDMKSEYVFSFIIALRLHFYKELIIFDIFKSVILEKEEDITQDPRGVVLTGDALRSLWTLGLGKYITSIGQGMFYVRILQQIIRTSGLSVF